MSKIKEKKATYTREEQKQMKMNAEEGAEFFIASSSCAPGGIWSHSNICLNNFNTAINFAKSNSPYRIFCYGWEMYVWYYKVIEGKATLLKEINLNDYVIGALNENGAIVSNNQMREIFNDGCWSAKKEDIDKYKSVVYDKIPPIKITKPITEDNILSVNVPEIRNVTDYSFRNPKLHPVNIKPILK